MSTTSLTQSQLQHRKMLVFLPVVIVPFMTIFFHLFGGGKAVTAGTVTGNSNLSRLNADVPTAWKDNKIYNSKRVAYEKIGADSMTIRRNTSRSLLDGGLESLMLDTTLLSDQSASSDGETAPASALNYDVNQNAIQQANSPENKVVLEAKKAYEQAMMASGEKPLENSLAFSPSSNKANTPAEGKENQMAFSATSPNRTSSKTSAGNTSTPNYTSSRGTGSKGRTSKPLTKEEALQEEMINNYRSTQLKSQKMMELLQKRLEAENAAMAAASRGEKPAEEKKAAAQSTASVKINVKPKDNKTPVVTHLEQRTKQPGYIYQVRSLLSDTIRKGGVPRANNGFYSAASGKKENETANVILAAIHDEQTIEAGSTVKIRLLHDIEVGGYRIPRGSFIFGLASIDNSRMAVNITSIYFKEMLFPVDLTLYDVDGIKGLSTPSSVSRNIAKQGAAQAISGGNYIGTSPTPESQLTQKAIEVGEKVASRKLTTVRITLKAGHQVLLKPGSVESSK